MYSHMRIDIMYRYGLAAYDSYTLGTYVCIIRACVCRHKHAHSRTSARTRYTGTALIMLYSISGDGGGRQRWESACCLRSCVRVYITSLHFYYFYVYVYLYNNAYNTTTTHSACNYHRGGGGGGQPVNNNNAPRSTSTTAAAAAAVDEAPSTATGKSRPEYTPAPFSPRTRVRTRFRPKVPLPSPQACATYFPRAPSRRRCSLRVWVEKPLHR